ncbi:2-oxoglutarate ferredoxin oxidoreductase subunit alpha [Anaerobranca californiensis DSM 14826]|jgi:2-oxoglutarate ferredoxin oxidoreductase subunit alpha|uniref:2-oxoglutarate ferredoxin oxidoreductase subunit alpha n=1 Tax=Anaerobranca californiensis DSM 14826 TaxID=1120989 RepID=A0A1M6R6I4_9FIRM|nr:transketolase C-terminal domain-containing protein [Anaerobranca californiensis]SHK28085.1 2-oxoglutarate ferredoxin oxidoreductase subunit alpha [Anaerobranca californiensis DSM 14826]
MSQKPIQGEKKVFMTGNEVCAWAALAAKADIMYGYPITPQNEIMHYWTRLAPKFGKKFLQTEDEISAGFTTLGGALAGKKSFSATAGPGNTLFQEPMSMAEMMRIPSVVIIQQRGGPSTATVIYSQQEVTMTTFGGNGEGFRVVYSTSSHQELFDYTIKAFNTAWKYRFPTFVLGDGYQAKMRESLTIYDPEERGIELVDPEPILGKEGMPGVDRPAVHARNTYNTEEELYNVVMELARDFEKAAPEIVEYKEYNCEDADVVIIAHGVVTRAAQAAMEQLRKEGIKVGHFRPITLRPFPVEEMRAAVKNAKKILVVESSYGQLLKQVKEYLYGMTIELDTLLKPGVGITSDEIVKQIKG